MSLATRCTACGTIFRLVQEQLKVSEGWVRCGRCDGVFNAVEVLFDLERDAPPNWTPPPTPPTPPAAVVSATFVTASTPPQNGHGVFELSDDDRIHSRFFHPEQDDVSQSPSEAVSERDRVDFADARFNDELISETAPNLSPPVSKPRRIRGSKNKNAAAAAMRKITERAKSAPEFVRSAKRKAWWQSPAVRAGLAVASVVLSLGLLLQTSLHFRDHIAARWPSTKGLLTALCKPLNCRIELPRAINAITLESSSLSPAGTVGNSSDTYRLSVVLRNRHHLTLAMPWLDVAISDALGQPIARRTLSPQDIRAKLAIDPETDTTLQTYLSVDNQTISGYTVEAFYP
jgi:predicted Zn finger-like uncharacterized protein